MDEAVKLTVAAAVLAACALGAARAEPLADPTRPPASLSQAAAGPAASAPPAGPVLQSVLIARHPGGRQVAVIDGETVRLGGAFHGAVLVRMTETEVELQRGSGRQVLKLFAAASPKTAK
jgi:MSHA biogenesis protein MshK